jgi:hypothetical protein
LHDLLRLYSKAGTNLASSPNVAEWESEDDASLYRSIFRRGDLPAPPAELSTGGMYVRRGVNTYPSLAVDCVHLFAPPDVCRCLGLWIVACLLEPSAHEFWLRITHAGSEVRRVCVDTCYRSLDGEREGLHTQPHAVVYYPGVVAAFPLADQPSPLPSIRLTDSGERLAGFGDDDDRDAIVGFGSDAGAWRFAEVLLNLSQAWNERVEAELEGAFGFGGVAPDSAEVRFWLPGSARWDSGQWTDSPTG